MKVLLVYSLGETQSVSKPITSPESINFGLSYIAGVLKENGHEPDMVVLSSNRQKDSIRLIDESIESFRPDIIGFSMVSTQHDFVVRVGRHVRERYPHVYLAAGGPMFHSILIT
jgi:hypothetical protein